jgi:hypothetical protein
LEGILPFHEDGSLLFEEPLPRARIRIHRETNQSMHLYVSLLAETRAKLRRATHIDELIRDWNSAPPDVFIFQTGVGTRALFAATDLLGLTDILLRLLDSAQVVVRGPKPATVLHSRKVRIDGAASDPFTTREVLAEMHDRPRQPIESRDRDGRGHRRRRADVG